MVEVNFTVKIDGNRFHRENRFKWISATLVIENVRNRFEWISAMLLSGIDCTVEIVEIDFSVEIDLNREMI